MTEISEQRFEESFEYAYSRPYFRSFLLSQRRAACIALAITASAYFGIVFFIFRLMNSNFNIAFVVFSIILLFIFLCAGYPFTRSLLRHYIYRNKIVPDGYRKFLIDVLNAYFEEEFSEGNTDFDISIYERSRPVNKRYDSCYADNNGACIHIRLKNGIMVSFFGIRTFKFGGGNDCSNQENYFSVFAVADIKTYGRINLCNYEQKVSSYIPQNEFKTVIDEGSVYFNCDSLINFLGGCKEMVNITAEGEEVYIEIAKKSLTVSGISRRKLVKQTKAIIENALLIIGIVYCISDVTSAE